MTGVTPGSRGEGDHDSSRGTLTPTELPASLAGALADLRATAGSPSYQQIALRISAARQRRGVPPNEAAVSRSTVYDCFRPGRSRLNAPLVLEIAAALDADQAALDSWREALIERQRVGSNLVVRVDEDVPDSGTLIGRDELVDRLVADLGQPAGTKTRSLVVTGMPGVGKTALVHSLARRLEPGFDRVLLVNLDGFTEGRVAADPATVAEGLLRTLVGGPAAVGDPLARLRELLSTRRVLLVLDNAADQHQVAELLPPTRSTSLALVTTRVEFTQTAGLQQVRLSPLGKTDALRLLVEKSGRSTGAADDELRALASSTGGLPLALILLARRIREQPDWPLADHRAAHEQRMRLLALDDGLQGSLARSCEALAAEEATALRLLALAPGPDLGTAAARALLGDVAGDAEPGTDPGSATLRRLAAKSLVTVTGTDRWGLHDLVRRFARRTSVDLDPPSVLTGAARRLLEHYLTEATQAVAAIYPRSIADWTWPHAELDETDEVDALAWLADEQANLVHAVTWAAEEGWDDFTVRLATVLWAYLADRSEADTNLVLQRLALAAAERADDLPALAVCRRNLGHSLARLGRPGEARPLLEAALAESELVGDPLGVVQARNALSVVVHLEGDHDETLRLLTANIEERRDAADVHLTNALLNLGVVLTRLGRRDEALARLEEAAAYAEAQGWVAGEQLAANNITTLLQESDRLDEAHEAANRALRLARRLRRPRGVAYATATLASVRHDLGDLAGALRTNDEALDLARELGIQELEAMALNNAGDYLRATEPGLACDQYAAARALAEQIGSSFERDRAVEALQELGTRDGQPI